LQQIAKIIIAAIEGAGLTYLVDRIVRDLQSRGLHSFAMTLTLRAQRSQGNNLHWRSPEHVGSNAWPEELQTPESRIRSPAVGLPQPISNLRQ
jgi:hypothetical protein